MEAIVAPLLCAWPRCGAAWRSAAASASRSTSAYASNWEVLEVDPSPLAAAGAEEHRATPLRRAYFSAELNLGPEPFEAVILWR